MEDSLYKGGQLCVSGTTKEGSCGNTFLMRHSLEKCSCFYNTVKSGWWSFAGIGRLHPWMVDIYWAGPVCNTVKPLLLEMLLRYACGVEQSLDGVSQRYHRTKGSQKRWKCLDRTVTVTATLPSFRLLYKT